MGSLYLYVQLLLIVHTGKEHHPRKIKYTRKVQIPKYSKSIIKTNIFWMYYLSQSIY